MTCREGHSVRAWCVAGKEQPWLPPTPTPSLTADVLFMIPVYLFAVLIVEVQYLEGKCIVYYRVSPRGPGRAGLVGREILLEPNALK